MFDMEYYMLHMVKISSSRTGKILYGVLAGSLGAIILVLFLTGMSFSATVGDILPVIIGFNTALTGYMVLEKTRDGVHHKRTLAISAGTAVTLVTTVLLNIIFYREAGIFLIGIHQLITLIIVGIVTSWLGGMLAIRYFNLNK